MKIVFHHTREETSRQAAHDATKILASVLKEKAQAVIILATGASQFHLLKELVTSREVDWSRVIMFHPDEYIGLPLDHPASFRRYIQERFISKVQPLKAVNLIK